MSAPLDLATSTGPRPEITDRTLGPDEAVQGPGHCLSRSGSPANGPAQSDTAPDPDRSITRSGPETVHTPSGDMPGPFGPPRR
jgi:hypothetical protein